MDLNRLQKLAGMPLTEGTKSIEKTDIHISTRPHTSGGITGDMVNILDPKVADALADLLGIKTGWKMVKVGSCFAAYQKGHLVFFTDKNDFIADLYD